MNQVLKTGNEQAGSSGEHKAQSHLADNQRRAHPIPANDFASSTLFQSRDEIGS
jgi:hypothetical protein